MFEREIGNNENRTSVAEMSERRQRKEHKKATGRLDKEKGKTMTDQDASPLIVSIFWQ